MMAPTAMTSAAHAEYVAWTDDDDRRAPGSGQSERGRLLDIVLLAAATIRAAIRRTRDVPTDPLTFAIRYVPHDGTSDARRRRAEGRDRRRGRRQPDRHDHGAGRKETAAAAFETLARWAVDPRG